MHTWAEHVTSCKQADADRTIHVAQPLLGSLQVQTGLRCVRVHQFIDVTRWIGCTHLDATLKLLPEWLQPSMAELQLLC